ncbi:MAG: hypothetical protein ACKO7R_14200 [Pseudanabaena sp.]
MTDSAQIKKLATQARLHLHRGIGYLADNSKLKRFEELILLVKHTEKPLQELMASQEILKR